MTLDRSRPEILTPPEHPPACCTQQTITVPPAVAAKTRQKYDYPSAVHRRSYARRTGSERTFSTIKDPATTSIARGWCRLTGLTPLTLWLACLLAVRNQRILAAFDARQAPQRPPRRRRAPAQNPQTRRKTLASLAAAAITAQPPARHASLHPAHTRRTTSAPCAQEPGRPEPAGPPHSPHHAQDHPRPAAPTLHGQKCQSQM